MLKVHHGKKKMLKERPGLGSEETLVEAEQPGPACRPDHSRTSPERESNREKVWGPVSADARNSRHPSCRPTTHHPAQLAGLRVCDKASHSHTPTHTGISFQQPGS